LNAAGENPLIFLGLSAQSVTDVTTVRCAEIALKPGYRSICQQTAGLDIGRTRREQARDGAREKPSRIQSTLIHRRNYMTFHSLTGTRRALLALVVAGAAALASTPTDAAPPAQQQTQVPGYYRMALGDFEVTPLYDGYINLDRKLLSGASAQDIQRLLARMFIMNSQVQTTVNAYLVHTGSRLVLVDTGVARLSVPPWGSY
jgi:hypothetical protein